MIVWLDLMPIFPPPDDRVHASIGATVTNHSEVPVQVEIESVKVKGADDGKTLLAFEVEPLDGWSGALDPSQTAAGEWRKTDLIFAGTLECDAAVVGVLRVVVLRLGSDDEDEDSDDEHGEGEVLHVVTPPTPLSCVF